jgi:glycosyltransferase involved in cell wall biosynthesis
MKLALVVPRYGEELVGSAALHARWIARRLAAQHAVEIVTTAAEDGPPAATLDGLTVRRFPVTRRSPPAAEDELDGKVRSGEHTADDERRWLEARGPLSPGLVDYVRDQAGAYDVFLFFSYSAWTTYHGLPHVRRKSLLIPTADDENAARLYLFPSFLRLPAAFAFNTPEEKDELQRRADAPDLPGDVVGLGIDDSPAVGADEIRQRLDLLGDFFVYSGRIGREQGCSRLFEDFTRYVRERSPHVSLVLVGKAMMPIPVFVNITHLGLLSDVERRSAIGASRALVQPSAEGGLTLSLLEAWSAGRPALVNGRCPALVGQVTRGNGGLFYTSYEEMAEALSFLLERPREADALGSSGREYFEAHHAWPVVLDKYERLLAAVRGH